MKKSWRAVPRKSSNTEIAAEVTRITQTADVLFPIAIQNRFCDLNCNSWLPTSSLLSVFPHVDGGKLSRFSHEFRSLCRQTSKSEVLRGGNLCNPKLHNISNIGNEHNITHEIIVY